MEQSSRLSQNFTRVGSDMQPQQDIEIIFVLGLPGSGKGTLCTNLTKQFGCYHLSVGDHLRALCDLQQTHKEEAFGGLSRETIRANLKARKLLEADPLVAIIVHKLMEARTKGHRRIVIDGFPRSDDSAEAFENKVSRGSTCFHTGELTTS